MELKSLKKHPTIDRKFDTKKGAYHAYRVCTCRGPRGVQLIKTPPEETYINRKKTKRRCPTCKKSKEGTNNLQKYQTDDQRKVIYEGKLPKGDLQKVIYEGKLQKR